MSVFLSRTAEIARGMKLLAKKKGVSHLNDWFEATLLDIITDQGNVSIAALSTFITCDVIMG